MTAQVTSRIIKGVAVVSVDGELDVHTSPRLRSSIRHMLAEGQTRIIVNLLKTTYLDGQALAVLTAAQRQARTAGGNIGFVHNQPLFTRLFSLAGVRGAFPAFRTEALAVRAARRWTGTSPHA
jgi:anti-sigma B factor antagonist